MKKLVGAGMLITALSISACDFGENDHFDVREPGKFAAWVERHNAAPDDHVVYGDGTLSIERKRNSTNSLIYDAGATAYHLLQAFQSAADHKGDFHALRVTYNSELFDKYNHSVGVKPVVAITFHVPECLKYNMEKSGPFDMLECAEVDILHPAASDAPRKYCIDEGERKWSPTFCAKYATEPAQFN